MDRRDLFKVHLKSDAKEARKLQMKKQRAEARDNMRFDARNISISDSPIATTSKGVTPNVENRSNRRQECLTKYISWKTEKTDSGRKVNNRPPFIAVVPVGRYVEAPENHALIKRIKHQNEKRQERMASSKNIGRTAERQFQPTTLQVDKGVNRFVFGARERQTRAATRKNKENVFNFVHSTARKKQDRRVKQQNIAVSVNAEELFDGISPIDPISSNEESPQPNLNQTVNIDTSPAGTEILLRHDDEGATALNTTVSFGEKDLNDSVNRYMSPYVVTARGKGSAKREMIKRQSVYKLNSNSIDELVESKEMRLNREASLYFEKCLNSETTRLEQMADTWMAYKNENVDLIADSIDMIDVTIGQTRLLIANKFQQFRGLIIQCREQSGLKKIDENDLDGFWNMLKIQIENLDNRFLKLEAWRLNSWADPDTIKNEVVVTKPKRAKKKAAPKKAQRKSCRSDLRQIMDNFKANCATNIAEEKVIIPETPQPLIGEQRLTRRRASVLIEKGTPVSMENRKAADKYEKILDDEISRLDKIADTWDEFKNSNGDLSSENADAIDVATGQTRLLIGNKFEQFRGLIRHCRNGTGDMKTNANDLEGFWMMLQIQVENLNKRFNDLDDLKNRNWIPMEIVPTVTSKPKQKKIKTGRVTKKTNKKREQRMSFKSDLRNLMKNIQEREMKSPKMSPERSRPSRKSLLATVLTSQAKKQIATTSTKENSPQFSPKPMRTRRQSIVIVEKVLTPSPTKSSLKKPSKKRANKSKSVAFKDFDPQVDDIQFIDETVNLISPETPKMNLSIDDGMKTPVAVKQSKRKYIGTPRNKIADELLNESHDSHKTPQSPAANISERHMSSARRNRRQSVAAASAATDEQTPPVKKINSVVDVTPHSNSGRRRSLRALRFNVSVDDVEG